MDKNTWSFTLLTLFTSRERALEIEGDLIEQSKVSGRLWKVVFLFHTTFVLFRHSFGRTPFSSAMLALSSIACLVMVNFLLQIHLGKYLIRQPLFILILFEYSLYAVTALLLGMGLARWQGDTGIRAAACASFLGIAWLVVRTFLTLWHYFQANGSFAGAVPETALRFFLCAVFSVLPLFAGSVIVHRRSLDRQFIGDAGKHQNNHGGCRT